MKPYGYLLFLILGMLLAYWSWHHPVTNSPPVRAATSEKRVQVTPHFRGTITANPSSASNEMNETNEKETQCWNRINEKMKINEANGPIHFNLEATIGDWFYSEDQRQPQTETSWVGEFVLGVARAGLLQGREVTKDPAQALDIFADLARKEPNNSAPLLFEAVVASQQGNQKLADELVEEAAQKKIFATHFSEIGKKIFNQVQTPADLLRAQGLWSSVPVPNYTVLGTLLERNPNAEKIALQLMAPFLENKTGGSDFEPIPIEYAAGNALMNKVKPGNTFPNYHEIIQQRTSRSILENITPLLETNCDLDAVLPILQKVKEER